jgi:basic membrane protein A and related proteins
VSEETNSSGGGSSQPRSTLHTFLIADVRGYTRFTQEHGDDEAARLAARFAELARSGIARHGGQLLELRGDEALGVFTSARDALRAAVDLQRLFRERTDGVPALALGVGIGLDAGEAVPVEGGFRGGALNLAARLCSLAAPGEILASETVVSLARRVEGIRFEVRGLQRLKGLEDPVKVIEVVSETALPPVPVSRWASLRRLRRKHVTRRKAVAALLVALTAAAGAVLGLALLGQAQSGAGTSGSTRVALVRDAGPGPDDLFLRLFKEGLVRAVSDYGIETEEIPSSVANDNRIRIEEGDFDLVLMVGGPAVAPSGYWFDVVSENPETHFVFVDTDLAKIGLVGMSNVTALRLRSGPAAQVAGYLGGLVARRSSRGDPPMVSVVAGVPLPAVEELVKGFVAGARRAVPGVVVDVRYSNNFDDQTVCEKIANDQIDKGSDVVFPVAGECGLGAIAAAGIRGVWAVGVDTDQSHLGSHVLASVAKRFDQVIEVTVRRFLEGTLPGGQTVGLGIEDDAVGVVGISTEVPSAIRTKLAREAARVRAREAR